MFVGIDPGLTGAIAVLDHTGMRHLADLPTMNRGAGTVKRQINGAALTTYLREMLHDTDKHEVLVAIEKMGAMPKQGVASMLSIGLTAGIIEGVVAARGYRFELIPAAVWKKAMKVTATKEHARAAAQRMFPAAELHLVKHHNRAEALLLAAWAQREYA